MAHEPWTQVHPPALAPAAHTAQSLGQADDPGSHRSAEGVRASLGTPVASATVLSWRKVTQMRMRGDGGEKSPRTETPQHTYTCTVTALTVLHIHLCTLQVQTHKCPL